MIKYLTVAVVSTSLIGFGVPASARPGRGDLLSAMPITGLSVAEVTALLARQAIDTGAVRHGVDAYRLEYRTAGPDGRPITASGAVVLPRDGGPARPTVAFQHGTIAAKAEAGSVGPDTNRTAPITFAAAGYTTVAPDYLGLGTGEGTHPYLDLPTETGASVDLLRAADTFVRRAGRTLDRRVLVAGFSQGGPAAMALGRALRDHPRFAPRAVASISGVHDLFGTQFPAALDGTVTPKLATISTAYYLVAANRLHHLYDRASRAFRAPYDAIVENLFDGLHSGPEIAASLPATPADLLTGWAVGQLRRPTGPMVRAARATDGSCVGWDPGVPVRLYAGTEGDELVPLGNSTRCRAEFLEHGADAPIVDLGPVNHNTSAKRAYPLVLEFFAGQR
ncbi:alpha/beta fold hydrolase [Saccharothrix violaceirubra]|uniref:Acetyl esterase/lipase n=1 Tax=Saccharothrix violaceirubra TaxID=413306 RepID=A0A7W7WW89_9PSEU|nr:hypothetical protein [Saccharothrix violaceirubra]MBB4965732.1 acetyl esterase/lipase [Saccharothrix violaceirubra]